MIIRYSVKCAGCNSKIALRLQIGIDTIQPFYFVCQKCGGPTKGLHKIDYSTEPPSVDLLLEDIKIIDIYWDKPDQTLTLAPDLPCILNPEDDPEESFPIFLQLKLMGNKDNLLEYQSRIGNFRAAIESDWPKYRRLISYYLDRNWKQFDKEIKNIFRKKVPSLASELDRHDYFERSLNILYLHIQPNLSYLELMEEINNFINDTASKDMYALSKFVSSIEEAELMDFQVKLLERLSFIVENFSTLSAGFPIVFYSNDNKSNLGKIRIMRDDFEILKSHYLGCFEISHKILKIIVGLINVYSRGDADLFKDNKPKSIQKFTELPNARKTDFLDTKVLPKITRHWNTVFDRKMRNAIGHYGVRHDLRTGMLVHDEGISIPYSEFVLRNLELLPIIQFCLHIVKKIYAINFFLGEK